MTIVQPLGVVHALSHVRRRVPRKEGRASRRDGRRVAGASFAAHARWAVSFGVLLLLGGCDALPHGFLNPQGPVAAGESHLFLIVVIVMLFVIGPVVVLVPLFAWHYRLANRDNKYRPNWSFSWTLEFFIWIPPTAIVIGLAFPLWHRTHQYDPYTPIPSTLPPIEVQAVALDWKWLFIYPDSGIATINELALPVGRTVHVNLTSGTVMQSLLVPQLAGQIYAMSGMTTQLNLAADRTGTFLGENTQYNGTGFAHQKFPVRSMTAADFERWQVAIRAGGHPFDEAAYRQLFVKSVVTGPVHFSVTPGDLFQRILENDRTGTLPASNTKGRP